ncbi:MAG: hypothetical protein ABW003_04500 [Microvirga sp.]
MEQAKTEDPEQAIEIGQIARAEKAAASGDAHEVLSALKGVGKWTLGIAEKVGVGLVIAALKSVG